MFFNYYKNGKYGLNVKGHKFIAVRNNMKRKWMLSMLIMYQNDRLQASVRIARTLQ